jgi:hypothetical protein
VKLVLRKKPFFVIKNEKEGGERAGEDNWAK